MHGNEEYCKLQEELEDSASKIIQAASEAG